MHCQPQLQTKRVLLGVHGIMQSWYVRNPRYSTLRYICKGKFINNEVPLKPLLDEFQVL